MDECFPLCTGVKIKRILDSMKMLYITTISATMGFFYEEFLHLQKRGYEIELACNCEEDRFYIKNFGMPIHNIPFSRTPFSLNNLKAYDKLKRLVRKNHYDIIHCHTPNASVIARLACKEIRKKGTKVIYTAHGFHFYKGASKKNWVIYYPIEWICAHWTDILITINREDYALAKKKMKAKRIEYVPGVGINVKKFSSVDINIAEKRAELGIPTNSVVLFSVGELNENKNHETVLKAISGIDVYYMIAGKGDKEKRLQKIAKEVGVSERFQLLGFRRDIAELLQVADIFVFPSFREGLSVSLMESMANGKPAVVSRIRGNVDLIDEEGGVTFAPYSVDECRAAIQKVIESDRDRMGKHNREKIKEFSTENILKKMDEIYKI